MQEVGEEETMKMEHKLAAGVAGTVQSVAIEKDATVEVAGANSWGDHVTGTVRVALPVS